MVQVAVGRAVQPLSVLPLVGGPVTAGRPQAVPHRAEDRPLDGKREAAFGQKLLQHRRTARLAPAAFQDAHGAEAEGTADGKLAPFMGGQDEEFRGEAGAGAEQPIDGTAFLQVVESPEGGQDGLLGLAVVPVVFDELQVGTRTRLLGAEDQGGLRV